jgi:hypothetical protein
LHVHQDQVEGWLVEAFQHFQDPLAGFRHRYRMSSLLQQTDCHFLIDQVIFGEKNIQPSSAFPQGVNRDQRMVLLGEAWPIALLVHRVLESIAGRHHSGRDRWARHT